MWLMYALLSAVFFGLRGVLYHWTSKKGLERNLMLFGVFFTGAVVCSAISFILRQQWSYATLTGIFMGLFSFGANASIFKGFAVGKASLVAILTGLPPVVVVVLAYLLWEEAPTLLQLAAFIVIVAGILLVRYSNDLRLGNLQGAQWGLLAMLFFGLNDMAVKQSTRLEADLFPTLTNMFIVGSVLFCIGWLFDRRRARLSGAKPSLWSVPRTFLTGMLVGTTNVIGMITIATAFDLGITGLVSAVVALNVLIILLYSRIFLREKFKPVELTGIVTAMAGLILLRLFD
ncbi:EamA family transporter [Paenibacillus tarimensis]